MRMQFQLFAYDINVLISNSDERLLQSKICRVVAELETWFNGSDVVINARKTRIILFHNRQTHVLVRRLVTFNFTVDYTAEIKFLGIQITDTLKWHSHIQLLAGKLCKVAFMIKPLKEILSPNFIRNIYFTKFYWLLWFSILFCGGSMGSHRRCPYFDIVVRLVWSNVPES